MATRLKDNYKSDDPVASIDADWLNTVARWLNTINVNGGPRFATPFDLRLYLASGEGGSAEIVFSGTAYIAGRKITGLSSDSSKPWVRCFLDTATAEEHAGPPPDPFPSNEEWYEKAQTAGNIHIPRA